MGEVILIPHIIVTLVSSRNIKIKNRKTFTITQIILKYTKCNKQYPK